jgi:hypothetical protein
MSAAVSLFIAPMKKNFLRSIVQEKKWHRGLVLFAALVLIGCGFTDAAAQSRTHRRVTSVRLGESAEGARVTVVADSALSDYEAFRHGDRFYVKIPFASFTTAQPHFRGDGFDDIQIQTVGDGVVISFKLQPGATARVEQQSKRLQVIFSAVNRIARNNASSSVFNRVPSSATSGINRLSSAMTPPGLRSRTAGPSPYRSSQADRRRVVVPRQSEWQAAPKPPGSLNARGSSKKTEKGSSVANATAEKSLSQVASPSPARPSQSLSPSPVRPSPTPYSYQPSKSSTPVVSVGSRPAVSSSGQANSQNDSQARAVREWMSAHRALLGALIALGALLLLAAVFYRRRKSVVETKGVKEPRVQPTYSPNIALSDSLAADALVSPNTGQPLTAVPSAVSPAPSTQFVSEYKLRPPQSETPVPDSPIVSASVSPTSRLDNPGWNKPVPEPAMAGSAPRAVSPNHASVLSSPSTSSAASIDDQITSEDQDREVFEL